MCIPLGGIGRRGWRSHRGRINTVIEKSEVISLINYGDVCCCLWKRTRCRIYRDYDVSNDELVSIIEDENTKVSVANTSAVDEYKRGYRTIVVEAPCVRAKILLRAKNS